MSLTAPVPSTPLAATDTMRALTYDVKRDPWESTTGLTLDAVPRPVLDPQTRPRDAEQVVIRVRYAGFCGSDRGIWWRKAFKDMIVGSLADQGRTTRVIGHELVGEIVEVGRLARLEYGYEPGQIVSSESHIICGRCLQCKVGDTHVCANDTIIGISTDGCFAEYIKLPARVLWPTDPDKIRLEVAAIQEPFGNAIHACQKVDLRGRTVAVFGTGTIGLFTILGARALGASKVFGIEPNANNRVMAKHLGCDEVIPLAPKLPADPERAFVHDDDVVRAVRALTPSGVGVDVAIEMSGYNTSLNNAIKSVRRGGDVILFGIQNGDFTIEDYHRVIMDGISLHSVVGRQIFATWNVVQHLLESRENRIQERIFDVILRGGEDTIVPLSAYTPAGFEQKIRSYPKVLFAIDP